MKRNGQYWTEDEKQKLNLAQSFGELVPIALAVLGRMPQPIGQVAGPISTGGLGTVQENIAVFDATIELLIQQGLTIFDQVPFEDHIFRLREGRDPKEANRALLNKFYLPIFNANLISHLYFIHGWESSEGANWEHEQAERLGMQITYLEKNLV